MQNIDNIIEIKRGLHKICSKNLVNLIADLDSCEDFYQNVFLTYGLLYNTETIRQKRVFVAAITKYFILDRLPEGCLFLNEGKYDNNDKRVKTLLVEVIEKHFQIFKTSTSHEDFKKRYAEHYHEEIKDFSKEISENRDDSLSDFAKSLQKMCKPKSNNNEKL